MQVFRYYWIWKWLRVVFCCNGKPTWRSLSKKKRTISGLYNSTIGGVDGFKWVWIQALKDHHEVLSCLLYFSGLLSSLLASVSGRQLFSWLTCSFSSKSNRNESLFSYGSGQAPKEDPMWSSESYVLTRSGVMEHSDYRSCAYLNFMDWTGLLWNARDLDIPQEKGC